MNISKTQDMSEWKEYKLGDFFKVKHGFAFPGKYISEEKSKNTLVTPGNFKIGGGFKSDKFKYYHSSDFPQEYILKKNDIVVTMTDLSKESDTLGYSAKIPKATDGNIYLHNQRIGLLLFKENKEVSEDFMYWLLRTRDYQGYIVGSASGTSIMHTSPSRIEDYDCILPPLPEQRAIASVLSSLDDKIDLLHRQNTTLEKMAETLFRQWFIEEAKEEWEEKSLGELVDVVIDNRGKTPPTLEYYTSYPLIEVNAINSDSCLVNYDVIRKYVDEMTYNNWFRKHLHTNDLIISTVGTIGVFSLFLNRQGCIAQNLIGLRFHSNISSFFIYNFFKNNVETLLNLDIGGVQPSIKVPHLLGLEIKIPPQTAMDRFHGLIEKHYKKISKNQQQIHILTSLRDTLLPKLMSGEVRVEM